MKLLTSAIFGAAALTMTAISGIPAASAADDYSGSYSYNGQSHYGFTRCSDWDYRQRHAYQCRYYSYRPYNRARYHHSNGCWDFYYRQRHSYECRRYRTDYDRDRDRDNDRDRDRY